MREELVIASGQNAVSLRWMWLVDPAAAEWEMELREFRELASERKQKQRPIDLAHSHSAASFSARSFFPICNFQFAICNLQFAIHLGAKWKVSYLEKMLSHFLPPFSFARERPSEFGHWRWLAKM